MSFTPHEYYLQTAGKSIDKDGAYGAQCWDLWADFTDKCGYPRFNCTQSGYVKDIANLKHQSGLLNYFDEVALGQQQDGDWFVWDFGNISHIAMFRLDNGNGTGIFLGQNQGASHVNQINYSYANVIGIFRPKIWKDLFPKVAATASVEEIARGVIAGNYGNGSERRTAIESMGYNYDEVQARVNEIMGGSPVTSLKNSETIAREVIAGKWGNGADRRARLEAAGYNFTEIQNLVNKLLA